SPGPPGRLLTKYIVSTPVSGSTRRVGSSSSNSEFTPSPRLKGSSQPRLSLMSSRKEAKISKLPKPLWPLLQKNSQCSSGDRARQASWRLVLNFGPRFWAGSQSLSVPARWVTQRSLPPKPPGRSELKKRLSSSAEMAMWNSLYCVLIDGPRLTGLDQSENWPNRDWRQRWCSFSLAAA